MESTYQNRLLTLAKKHPSDKKLQAIVEKAVFYKRGLHTELLYLEQTVRLLTEASKNQEDACIESARTVSLRSTSVTEMTKALLICFNILGCYLSDLGENVTGQ